MRLIFAKRPGHFRRKTLSVLVQRRCENGMKIEEERDLFFRFSLKFSCWESWFREERNCQKKNRFLTLKSNVFKFETLQGFMHFKGSYSR